MKKLIKLLDSHYIIVDDSEIKEGEPALHDFGMGYEIEVPCDPMNLKSNTRFKITHSTPIGGLSAMLEIGVRELSLQECEELTQGYSIEKMAEEEYPYEIGYSVSENNSRINELQDAYIKGFKAHQRLVQDRLFTIEEVRRYHDIMCLWGNIKAQEYLRSILLPKTEWEIEIDEQGKMKLI